MSSRRKADDIKSFSTCRIRCAVDHTKVNKNKDIALDCVRIPLGFTVAEEFKFKGYSVIAIQMPGISTVVIGKTFVQNPANCWHYPAGTPMKEAVSKSFKAILDAASKRGKAEKKA
jgi:hypothetical protein